MKVNLIHISYASMNLLIYAIKNNCFVVSPLAPLRNQVAGACDIPPRRATGSAIPAGKNCSCDFTVLHWCFRHQNCAVQSWRMFYPVEETHVEQ